jgi:hypothetical protein
MAEINPAIRQILKTYKIDEDEGILMLLSVYFKLETDRIIPEEVVTAVNLTKIVDKNYSLKTVIWNIPLFREGNAPANWNWVIDWVAGFGKINMDRRGSWQDAIPRMQDFFKKYPQYRMEDVIKARDLYFSRLTNPKFLMLSHKFIFDGAVTMKKSTLLQYCEELAMVAVQANPDIRGEIME